MKDTEKNIMESEPLNAIGGQSGMTVPEGYFKEFNERMFSQLPVLEFEDEHKRELVKRSIWSRVRPYVYMAAMFAGIWCMMNIFNLVGKGSDMSLDSHPALVAAVDNDVYFNDYIVPTIDDQTLMDELYDEGFDTADFENY